VTLWDSTIERTVKALDVRAVGLLRLLRTRLSF